jgi:hypothetical protein
MATKGRGGDSMLVHMTPGEVRALQALAERHGGTLTINPETGQPEANFLKSILPMVAGFALGPAGFGLMSAGMAGAAVGGITALSTGSLSRGLMAGLGAYGGASLGASLANAGTGAMAASDIAAQQAAGTFPTMAEGMTTEAYASQVGAARDAALAKAGEAGFGAKMSAGMGQMASNPGMYAKEMMTGLAAISPMMADEGVQTATPKQDTGNIRRFSFDRFGQTYTPQGVFPAEGYTGMAQGGIVALANGGTADQPLYLGLDKGSTPAQVAAAYSQFAGGAGGDTAANQREAVAFLQSRGIGDDVITQGYQQFLSPPQQAQAQSQGLGMTSAPVTTSAPATRSAYGPNSAAAASGASHTVDGIELVPGAPGYDPAKAAMRHAEISTYGDTGAADTLRANNLYDTGMAQWQTEYNRLHQQDIDAGRVPVGTAAATVGAPKASTTSATGGAPVPGTAAYNSMVGDWFNQYPNVTAAEIGNAISTYGLNPQDVANAMRASGLSNAALYSAFQPDVGVPDTPQGGLAGLNSLINQWIQKYPTATRAEAERAMGTWGYNAADIARATGKTLDQLFTGPIEDVTFLPGGVSGGGNTIVNPNGTITTTPNIPGRPEGGFTGMGQVRDAYTQGGGSLGYTNRHPVDPADFEARFNKQTGDSLAAYEYLMGRGANPTTQQRVGEIARPYSEAIVGIPAAAGRPNQKYIYQDGQYVENPNYAPVTYDSKGNRVVGVPKAEVIKGFDALKPAQTQANFDYVSYLKANPDVQSELDQGIANFGNKNDLAAAAYNHYTRYGKNDGREFTTTATAMPDDKTIFEWANTNNVSDAQLAERMGISVAEVARRRKKFTTPETGNTGYDMSGGDGAASTAGFSTMGTNSAPVSAMGGDTGFGDSSVGPAGGGGDTGNAPGSEGTPGSGAARGGLLPRRMALGGLGSLAGGGATSQYNLGGYSDGGRLLRGPGDGVSDSIPATIGDKQPARLADGEFVVPARIVSELGNGSTEAGARKLYAMMDRVQKARGKTTGKNRVAANTRADKYLPA